VELRAVTCVAGNASVDDVVRNTLKVLDIAVFRRHLTCPPTHRCR